MCFGLGCQALAHTPTRMTIFRMCGNS
jgi:hypothetical protein